MITVNSGAGTEWLLRENDVRLKESNKRSKERQGPTLGVRFTEVSFLCRCPLRESRLYLRTSPRRKFVNLFVFKIVLYYVLAKMSLKLFSYYKWSGQCYYHSGNFWTF